MEGTHDFDRRTNAWLASKVQCGVSLQFIAGTEEARRYLLNCGAPSNVIERVLSYPSSRRPAAETNFVDRRHRDERQDVGSSSVG